ncbi:MAG TPA: T6SS amidase immunity protein Tai4 family protein [Cellvibrio sp.]|nr:T6SS amidase immunity protein Tai4 family protein [Cellvibrio sp.]
MNSEEQKKIYKNWVLSKCIGTAFSEERVRQDAFNSASAYLELSRLPIESLTAAEPLIKQFLARDYRGSIPGSFQTKACLDLFYSNELETLCREKIGKNFLGKKN